MFSSNTTQVSDGGYQISRSLRFNSADSAYLNRTPATTTNRQIWTWSGWVKRGKLGINGRVFQAREGSTGNQFFLRFSSDNTIYITGSSGAFELQTTQVFRDPSAWYHIVFACDTTQATSSNRFKLYVNGSQVTAFGTATYPSQNLNTTVNSAFPHGLGAETSGPSEFFDGYITETYLIDGQQLTPSSFGETDTQTGVWKPKAYSGSYGTNGFYLNFSDNSNTTAATLGKDYSGNGNNWTPNGFLVSAGVNNDSLVDVPTSYGVDTGVGGTVRGNYATLNPLNAGNSAFLLNGNLDLVNASQSDWRTGVSTIAMSSGKWYAEITVVNNSLLIGIDKASVNFTGTTTFIGGSPTGWGVLYTGQVYNNAGVVYNNSSYSNGDIIGMTFDADTGVLTWYKNNVAMTQTITGLTSGPYVFGFSGAASAGSGSINFGQRPFAYTAPSGFKALCTQNLPTPTIGATTATQAGKFFNAVLYTGNNSTQSVTGVGFQPDLVWAKSRSNAFWHTLIDAVRGRAFILASNTTNADIGPEPSDKELTAFTSDGFNLGPDFNLSINTSGATFVAWNWKANGSGSTNTSGSITSTVSANTTSGFSIVTYTGTGANATVGHGLGVAPSMYIVKCRSNGTTNWPTYHQSITAANVLFLNVTDAQAAYSDVFNATNPTSSVFSIGTSNDTNGSGRTYVAYCFAPIAGYSAFGSYTGNGSADGPFVFTGFRPAFVMFKVTTVADEWRIYDEDRLGYNAVASVLVPNSSIAEETTSAPVDLLSNGFKIRGTAGSNVINGPNQTYIYMAFASNPFKYSLAR